MTHKRVNPDQIQLRINPIHADVDEEITSIRSQVRKLRNPLCPNNNGVHIYTLIQSKWEKLFFKRYRVSDSWACNDSCQRPIIM
ncbi:hypothetical protein RchiOBHm_Chr2g0095271 [Rosa chinensis]|uniref:Uncharacterized protein n=1 Tax=Rosa chinensis TaxID=74649 RepID=A0A2P6RKR4_ROSCH|nr:hypothetical protein RchiOBHm_Chr2g0095271 [Rosa chinensis]